MKSDKRRKKMAEKKTQKKNTMTKPKPGKSKYGLKHALQKRGYYSDTSPLRFGANAEE